jgi:hypothetical protein
MTYLAHHSPLLWNFKLHDHEWGSSAVRLYMALQVMHLSAPSEGNVERTVSTTISDCIIQMQFLFFFSIIYIFFLSCVVGY